MFYAGYPTTRDASSFMYAVYAWMAAALSVTAVAAYVVASTPRFFMFVHTNPPVFFGLFIIQIALVIGLSAALMRINFATAVTMFLVYALSVGVTLSLLLHVYTMESVTSAFITASAMFGGMALYGYVTKTDLTAVGNIGFMILWGMIIALLINMWFRNPFFDLVISGIGVVLFSLLTAYDSQKIKRIGQELVADEETMSKVALIGALTLYLDFINLFLYLLRFMGKRRD